MQRFSSGGVYVNYLGQEADQGVERIRAAYGPQEYDRLIALIIVFTGTFRKIVICFVINLDLKLVTYYCPYS